LIFLLQTDLHNIDAMLPEMCLAMDIYINKKYCIVHTELDKKNISNKLKKIFPKGTQLFIRDILEEDLNDFPFIIKDWFNSDSNQIINDRIKDNYEDIKNQALLKIDKFLNSVESELKKQVNEGGE